MVEMVAGQARVGRVQDVAGAVDQEDVAVGQERDGAEMAAGHPGKGQGEGHTAVETAVEAHRGGEKDAVLGRGRMDHVAHRRRGRAAQSLAEAVVVGNGRAAGSGEQHPAVGGLPLHPGDVIRVDGQEILQQVPAAAVQLLNARLAAEVVQGPAVVGEIGLQAVGRLAGEQGLLGGEVVDGPVAHPQVGQVEQPGQDQGGEQGKDDGLVGGGLLHAPGRKKNDGRVTVFSV